MRPRQLNEADDPGASIGSCARTWRSFALVAHHHFSSRSIQAEVGRQPISQYVVVFCFDAPTVQAMTIQRVAYVGSGGNDNPSLRTAFVWKGDDNEAYATVHKDRQPLLSR
jgi:hypothetical protein